MPTPIFLSKANAETEYETIDAADKLDTDTVVEEIHEEAKTEEKENENGEKEVVEVSPAKEKLKIVKRPVPLNDTNPLWAKNPKDCTDEEYKEFYRKVFFVCAVRTETLFLGFAPPRGFASLCLRHCSTCVAQIIRGMMI